MTEISPLDASILALLAQVPKGVKAARQALFEKTQQNLLERLSPDAREIGEVLLAKDKSVRSFSSAAQETAAEMERWAVANKAR